MTKEMQSEGLDVLDKIIDELQNTVQDKIFDLYSYVLTSRWVSRWT
jgi:hypothetical protein